MRRLPALGAIATILGLTAIVVSAPAVASSRSMPQPTSGSENVIVVVPPGDFNAPDDGAGDVMSVENAQFRWGVNAESNAAAFAPGTFNFLSAGIVTANSANDRVTAANWKGSDGEVSIKKSRVDGSLAPAAFDGLTTNASGARLTTGNGLNSGHVVEIDGGTGTVDLGAGTASIQWSGAFTVVYYSGMVRFWVENPKLTVNPGGGGAITATLGGYGTSMDEATKFEQLETVPDVTIATLANVTLGTRGLATTPQYAGVAVATPSEIAAQVVDSPHFGSFPQDFIDFQVEVGSASYWYSSGGSADIRKPATPVYVSYDAAAPIAADPPDQGSTDEAAGAAPSNPVRTPPAIVAANGVPAVPVAPAVPIAVNASVTTLPAAPGLVPPVVSALSPLVIPLLGTAAALGLSIIAVLSLMRVLPWQRRLG